MKVPPPLPLSELEKQAIIGLRTAAVRITGAITCDEAEMAGLLRALLRYEMAVKSELKP